MYEIMAADYIGDGSFNLTDYLDKIATRAEVSMNFHRMKSASAKSTNTYSNKNKTSTLMFKWINYLKRELNNQLEKEKKEGKEPSDDDLKMIKMIDETIPDIIIKECMLQRNINNTEIGGKRKSYRNRKSRKNRKSRRN